MCERARSTRAHALIRADASAHPQRVVTMADAEQLLGSLAVHPWAREVAPGLPPLSLADIDRCRKRRRQNASLSSCANLAIAGAASQAIMSRVNSYSNLSHHYHHIAYERTRHREALDSAGHRVSPTCIVTTLRDPATRLESAWRFQALYHGRLAQYLRGPCVVPRYSIQHCHLGFLVERFRNATDTCLHNYYNFSAGHPIWPKGLVGGHGNGPNDGDNFLVSQLHYLRGLDCDSDNAPELYFVCADDGQRFDDDWRAILRRFGVNDTADASANRSHHRSSEAHPRAVAVSTLKEEWRDIVRRQMYPWDWALHQHVCGSGTSE